MAQLRRRALSLLCAALLIASLVPGPALAAPAEDPCAAGARAAAVAAEALAAPAPEGAGEVGGLAASGAAGTADAPALISLVTADIRTSAEVCGALYALTAAGEVPLAPGSHERFVDRVDVPAYGRDFYDLLAEASDGDGAEDFLIEDAWFDAGVLPVLSAAGTPVGAAGGYALLRSAVLPGAARLDAAERDAAVTEATLVLYAMAAAFDRDHPEVFWMNASLAIGAFEAGDDVMLALVLAGGDHDARASSWRSEAAIDATLAQRDADAQAIVDELQASGAGAEPADAVRFLNRWLVEHNGYNADYAQAAEDYPAAWECVSALAGRTGARGPVCEGYARALKVLCDRLGIPCVLVDGDALADASAGQGVAHLWNYVELDGAWYAVDVTWNDVSAVDDPNPPFDARYNEAYLLVGADTAIGQGVSFLETHPVSNCVFERGPSFVNGPALAAEAYVPKAEPAVSVPTGLTATYGDALGSVALPAPAAGETPGAWAWAAPDQPVGDAGTRSFTATFIPDDRAAFAAVTREVTVTVAPKAVTPTVELAAPCYTWAGSPVTPPVTVRDGDAVIPAEEYAVAYENNDALGVATVRVTDVPGGNYVLAEATATFELVERLTPTLTVEGVTKTYDGVAVSPQDLLADVTATVEGHEVPGTWSAAEAPEMRDAGSYEVLVRFEPDDADAYLPAQVAVPVVIEPRAAVLAVELATNRLTADDAVEAPRLVVTGLVEGEALEPEVTPSFKGLPAAGQVGEHEVTWANADAVLEAARALPAAHNYEVALADSRVLTLTVADVTLAAIDDESLRVELGTLDAAPVGLAVTPFQTPEAVEAELLAAVREELPTVDAEHLAVYEAALFATDDEGRTWVPVDTEGFPAEGLTLTVPLPEGADPEAHRFAAAHMFTAAAAGRHPGDVEACAAAADADGVTLTVTGLSPVAVGWGDVPTPELLRATAMAQTGDRLAPFALALVCALSAGLVAAMSRRRVRG